MVLTSPRAYNFNCAPQSSQYLYTSIPSFYYTSLARYKWPHSHDSFSCAARCCKRQISCHNKRYIQSRPRTGEVQHVTNIETCTLLCCDYTCSTLWEALHVNMVEIGARCSDKNVKILGRYQWIGWYRQARIQGGGPGGPGPPPSSAKKKRGEKGKGKKRKRKGERERETKRN